MKNKISMKAIKRISLIVLLALFVASSYIINWQEILQSSGVYADLRSGMNVIFIDVGKADSALISAGGYNILVDAGISLDAEEITAVLDRYNIKTLDMVIASHSDSDHIGGMKMILDNYKVNNFVTYKVKKKYESESTLFYSMLKAIEQNDVSVTYTKAGDMFSFGKMELKVISPDREYEDSNDDSVIVKVSYGETDFLFTGDASTNVEENLLTQNADLECEVLKVSHHGSGTGTSLEFLEKVNPEIAVVSVGLNTNNLPDIETINRLKVYKNLELYRTDCNGNIHVHSDGKNITVNTEK